MTKAEQTRLRTWRFKVLQQASERSRNVARTCRHFGISRQAFYRWKQRYEAHGEAGLRDRAEVRDALQVHLRHEPTKVSRSRIKRLRGLSQPHYRLRVGDIRVFYDVTEAAVEVLAIVTKDEAQAWLDEEGTPTEGGGAR